MRPRPLPRTPRAVSAAAVAGLGLADLTLGVAAPRWAPTIFSPLNGLGATLAALISGLLLLLLARGLIRGLRMAWLLTAVLLLDAAIAAPLDHDGRALLSLLPVVILWRRRRSFGVVGHMPLRSSAAVVGGLVLCSVAGAVIHGPHGSHGHQIALIHVVRADDADEGAVVTHHKLVSHPHPMPGPTLPLVGVGAVLALVGAGGLTKTRRPRTGGCDETTRARAARLFAAHGANGVGYFATTGDKTLWTDPRGRGVVAFRLVGATALVVGDPLVAPTDLANVLERFLAHCYAQGWTPAFYQTSGATLNQYHHRGLRALAIGLEAVIDLPSFTLSGKRIANVRHSVTHAERAGLSVCLYDTGPLDAAVCADLLAISREWLAAKGGGDMGFSMGRLQNDGRPLHGARVAVAYDADGRAQALVSIVPAGGGRGWTLDLMRRRRSAVSGAMDLLIARTAEALRDEGYAIFSLSLAPLASTDADDEDAPLLARRARSLLYEKMGGAYSYRSLFNYKKKFNVRWETRYLVYTADTALLAAMYATARVHLPARLITLPRRTNGDQALVRSV